MLHSKTNVHAWNIPTLNILNCSQATIFNSLHTYSNRQKLARLSAETKNFSLNPLIVFKPGRLLLHELIVELSICAQFKDENTFQDTILEIYEAICDSYRDILNELTEKYSFLQQTCNDLDAADLAKLNNEYLNKIIPEVREIINAALSQLFKQYRLVPLAFPQSDKRITAIVAGGQASGKGSSVSLLKKEIEAKDLEWLDFVKINTDSYKPLVLKPGDVDQFQYSQLAQNEASIIHQKLFARLCSMADQGKAPHVLIDQVFVGEDKLKYAMHNGGKAIIAVVSTEVTIAIERSFQRGMTATPPNTGRFEDTNNILRCHKRFAQQLPETLAKFVGSSITARILDNNATFNTAPECAAIIFLDKSTGYITVLNKTAMKNFLKKLHINENARNSAEVYPTEISIVDEDITNYFSTMQISVKLSPPSEIAASSAAVAAARVADDTDTLSPAATATAAAAASNLAEIDRVSDAATDLAPRTASFR